MGTKVRGDIALGVWEVGEGGTLHGSLFASDMVLRLKGETYPEECVNKQAAELHIQRYRFFRSGPEPNLDTCIGALDRIPEYYLEVSFVRSHDTGPTSLRRCC